MRNDLKGTVVFDAGVIIEMLFSSASGKAIKDLLIKGVIEAITTETAILETEYILCRKLGCSEAVDRIEKLIASNYIMIKPLNTILEIATQYKCRRALSLPDCQVLALAQLFKAPAIFAKREEEIDIEIKREPFDVDILFLDKGIIS